MAKSRVARNGVRQYQITIWINKAAYREAQRRLQDLRASSGVGNITMCSLISGTLEQALRAKAPERSA